MHDASGKVIYVGKSKKLHDRVSQYFTESEKNVKTERMVSCVRSFEYIVCSTEIEALTLENTLIKKYSPRYNIKLKDAKSYPYIRISAGDYPRLSMVRKRADDKASYFGPYSGTSTVFSVIRTVNRIFRLPTCHRQFPKDIGRDRPCLYYQMGQCCGVCTGKVSKEEYSESIASAQSLLRGGVAAVTRLLEAKMLSYSDELNFEAAARCRDSVSALKKLSEHQKAVTSPDSFRDAAAIAQKDGSTDLCLLKIRCGAVSDRLDWLIPANIPDITAAAVSLLSEYYNSTEDMPEDLLLGEGFSDDDSSLLYEALADLNRHLTKVFIPQRGDGKALAQMAFENAAEYASRAGRDSERNESIAEKLALMLGLETVPERIEAYDISNIGSEHITAGMIVSENGHFKKRDYRYFRISGNAGQDDYAAMKEVLERRLLKLSGEAADEDSSFSSRPDLILVDGGEQHLATALSVIDKLGLDIPVAGMVKDDFHRTRALVTVNGEADIAGEQELFVFIYKIQEEIHRYTVARMTEAKRKTVRKSSLEKIPGIGTKKAALLLSAFGGLEKVKNAKPEELSGVKGINIKDAGTVYSYFHGEGGKK